MPIVCAQKDTTWSRLATASRSRSCRLMLQLGYILLAVSACSLLLNASGYNPRAATPQDLNTETFGGKSMDPFVKVMVCAPINVKVVPGPEHKLAITADASVERALSVNVDEGTLSIEATRSFRTNNAIQVTLVVPNNQLELVNIKSPKSTVAIGSGFSVRRFTGVVANKGELHLFGFNADEAILKTTGDSQVIARGNMRSMQIEATGTSKIYVKGSLRSVYAHVSGVSEVHLDPTTDDLKISGSVDGLSKILYTRGSCDIAQDGQGLSGVGAMAGGVGAFAGMQFGSMAGMGNVFGGGCQKMDSIKIPSVRPQWTCGLESTGKWTCAGMLSGSSSASASHSGNGQSFTSTGGGGAVSMSSSSGGGPRFSSSTGDGDTDFMYSTNEGSIRSLSCSSNTAEIRMFSGPSTAAS